MQALGTYLGKNGQIIEKLVLDNCQVSDLQFSLILEGLIIQKQLKELTYASNELGPKSIEKLRDLLDQDSGSFLRSIDLSDNLITQENLLELL